MSVIRKVQVRRGTAAAWSSANPVLSSGEFGYDETNDKVKVGDGATAWNSLAFAHYKPSEVDSSVPIINLDDWGVHPGNSAATNQAAIANVIAKIKNSSEINRFHLRLNRAGTFMLQRGTGDYATRKACIMLPSNCKFELGGETRLKLASANSSYLIRNDDPINGNVNIEVCGGIWDGNGGGNGSNQPADYSALAQGWYGMVMWFENITDLYVHDCVLADPGIWACHGTKLTRALWEQIHFDDIHRDGVHHCGTNTDITVRGITGTTEDNTIAFSSSQGTYFDGYFFYADGTPLEGNQQNIRVQDCTFTECDGPVAIFGKSDHTIKNIQITGLRGSTSTDSLACIAVANYPSIGSGLNVEGLVISDIDVQTDAAEPVIAIYDTGVKDLAISNVRVSGGSIGAVVSGSAMNSLTIDNIYGNTTGNILQLGNDSLSKPLVAGNIQIGKISNAPASSTDKNLINIQTNASWESLQIDSMSYIGTNTTRLINAAGATRRKIDVNTMALSGGVGIFSGPIDARINHLIAKSQTYIAEGNALVHAEMFSMRANEAGRHRAGSGGLFTTGRNRLTFLLDYTDINSIAATAASVFPQYIPRGSVVTGFTVKHTQAFGGGSISGCTIQPRRLAGGVVTWGSAVNVFSAVDSTHPSTQDVTTNNTWALNVDPRFDILVTTSGANLTALTSGRAYITIEYYIVGSSH